MDKERLLREEIIRVGQRLYRAGLAVAKSGNLSARLDTENILITASGTFLGGLSPEEIVKVNLSTGQCSADKKPSSELPLHSLIYKNFPFQTVIHCHPPLINGYFAVKDKLDALTFETKFYLGEVPVVPQETPTVTDPQAVVSALKSNNQVVLKNHGTITVSENFNEGLNLIEALEEAVRVAAVARLFGKDTPDPLERALKETLRQAQQAYEMFSAEHIRAIVELVNKDEFIAQKGKELDLTVQLAIKLNGTNKEFKFNFEKGRITRLDQDARAPFVISAPAEVWEQVFLGKLDSFVAVTQGKMKLEGQLGQLSKWYVPFTRLFAIFKEVKIK
jgi:L-fuculose-phosphate aldolase